MNKNNRAFKDFNCFDHRNHTVYMAHPAATKRPSGCIVRWKMRRWLHYSVRYQHIIIGRLLGVMIYRKWIWVFWLMTKVKMRNFDDELMMSGACQLLDCLCFCSPAFICSLLCFLCILRFHFGLLVCFFRYIRDPDLNHVYNNKTSHVGWL